MIARQGAVLMEGVGNRSPPYLPVLRKNVSRSLVRGLHELLHTLTYEALTA